MRVVLLTSDQRRHRYAARSLAQTLDLVGIVSEPKPASVPSQASEDDIVRRHFRERDEAERKMLGEPDFPNVERLPVPGGEINSGAVFRWIEERRPDLLVLYGTRIVKDPLLSAYPERIVNVHLGLSPYYRGSGTNFWPLVHRQPECVGVTIHLAAGKVDAGPILAQVRPEAEASDRCHELGTKALMKGLETLPGVLRNLPVPQDLSQGQVFRNRDFHAGAVLGMWANFDNGMMAEYLSDIDRRRAGFPLVEAA